MASVAAVKIAQQQAGMDDEEYRALLMRVAGVSSCTKLDDAGRSRVLKAIRCASAKADDRPTTTPSPLLRKLWALFFALRPTLSQEDIACPRAWLMGVARKANGDSIPERLEALDAKQLSRTVEALKARSRQFVRPKRRHSYAPSVGYSHDDGL